MIPPSTTITPEGRRRRRTLLWLGGAVIGLNVVVWLASALSSGGAVAGPDGSSFVTTAGGSAAVAGMLDRLGVDVAQSRRALDETDLDPTGTLLLIDVGASTYSPEELRALTEFMSGGGSVVVAGRADLPATIFPDASTWRSAGAVSARPVEPALDPTVFSTAHLSGFGSFDVTTADTPIWAADDGTVVAVTRRVGEGRFTWVADSAPFHNAVIGRGDTAVAVFHLVSPGGTAVFDEYRHGFAQDAGLWQVLPGGWRLALVLGAITALLALVAYASRFGPPHDVSRRLGPSRAAYLDAVAGLLSRAGASDDALATLRTEARRRLAGSGAEGANPEAVAASRGLDPLSTRAVLDEDGGTEALLAVDRALAILNQERE